jgi:putative aldouronate transport system substrate-binding protein
MSKNVKIFSLLISLLVVTAGCQANTDSGKNSTSSGGSSSTSSPVPSDQAESNEVDLSKKYTIKMFTWGPKDLDKDDAIVKHLNEKFNIDLKVERVLSLEYTKNLEVRIASGDMPDIFRYNMNTPGTYRHLYEDGYLMNFAEYADKYKLDGLKAYMSIPEMDEFKEEDGMYQLPSSPGKEISPILIRQDWLDQLGLEAPKSWDELQSHLQLIKDNKLGGDKTVGLVSSFGFFSGIGVSSVGWTGSYEWGKLDGEWTYEKAMPDYKGFLQYWKDMYASGLLDREIFTNNESQEHAKFTSGQAAAILTAPNRVAVLEKTITDSDKNAKISVINPWLEGQKGSLYGTLLPYTSPVVAIKKDKDEDFLARVALLMDYMHTEEGVKILNFGMEGVHYNMKDGQMVRTEQYDRDIIPALGNLIAGFTDYSLAKQDVSEELKKLYADVDKNAVSPPLTPLSYGDAATHLLNIEQKQRDWVVNFITGKNDVEKDWDAYIKEMNNAGLEKLTQSIRENN